MSSVRSGILADPFDPVRNEHIRFSLEKKKEECLDRVFLIIRAYDCVEPFRTDAGHRWKMLVSACASDINLVPVMLDDSPVFRSGEDVFRRIREMYPEDVLVPLPFHGDSTYPIIASDNDRDAVLLCPSVQEYCSLLGLYGRDPSVPEAAEWTDRLFHALTPHRFAHSLAVALTAKRLAALYGIDIIKAEKAGLLHDCAKCIPNDKKYELLGNCYSSFIGTTYYVISKDDNEEESLLKEIDTKIQQDQQIELKPIKKNKNNIKPKRKEEKEDNGKEKEDNK